ncbi:hypothetical protein AZA_74480 [Nitrospirillum viridazoti Y2]|nr:hypothetical protein AZA_74480 [Nitrospirillum amazonense Y2]
MREVAFQLLPFPHIPLFPHRAQPQDAGQGCVHDIEPRLHGAFGIRVRDIIAVP